MESIVAVHATMAVACVFSVHVVSVLFEKNEWLLISEAADGGLESTYVCTDGRVLREKRMLTYLLLTYRLQTIDRKLQ